ncbi:hypothetical protein [Bacteroides sp. 14(A)]|uniref:hypothetical protein n=1 Tax=Bacteroides sp. 14(A) TaxID=1163670 RepID=UPI00046E5D64|nr:hypothetical protein [Bacteroides sp. 14(A)]
MGFNQNNRIRTCIRCERELKEEAEKYIAKSKIDPNTYNCTMMSDNAYSEDGMHNLYGIGQRVNLINKAYFENGRLSRVIGFEFNLDKPYDSPVYTVGKLLPIPASGN